MNETNMNSDFFPEDYKLPSGGGNYMKLADGENTFRVLSSAITGYLWWTQDNKPSRSKEYPRTTPNIKIRDGKPDKPKHFWAFVVWNYDIKAIQILEVTQATIQTQMKAFVDNAKWGDPKKYDITINRKGEGLDTEYSVMPNPHSDIPEDAVKLYADTKIDLEALYAGADPFDPNWVSDAVPFP